MNTNIQITSDIIRNWQNIVDTLAEILDVPAALIMRIVSDDIEVFVSSLSNENPYTPGDKEHLIGSGLYCETVITTQNKLLVPNALEDENWKNNPDVKLNMISYLGFPLTYPDGEQFGTICVLDSRKNAYSTLYENLILHFRDIIQSQLELVYINHQLGEENKSLAFFVEEIKTLRGIIPICMHCKKIRDDDGFWKNVEDYITSLNTDTLVSHGICPECMKRLYPDISDPGEL